MLRQECTIGMNVLFGRPNGEKTLGVIVKLNDKKAKVKTLEGRGVRNQAGVVWAVPYSLIYPSDGTQPAAAAPAAVPAAFGTDALANIRLRAAAPELLAALEYIASFDAVAIAGNPGAIRARAAAAVALVKGS